MTKTRMLAWWRLAVAAVGSLTAPRTDVSTSDDQVERVFRTSSLYAAGHACSAVVGTAWRNSMTRAVVNRVEHEAIPPSGPQRVRAVAVLAAIAVIASLTLQLVTLGAIDPLNWVLPVAVAAGALAALLWAHPIARALKDKNS
jgi:hypothetical protein